MIGEGVGDCFNEFLFQVSSYTKLEIVGALLLHGDRFFVIWLNVL